MAHGVIIWSAIISPCPFPPFLFILGAGSVGYDVKVRLKWAFVSWYRRKKEKTEEIVKKTYFSSDYKTAKRSEKCRNVSVLC